MTAMKRTTPQSIMLRERRLDYTLLSSRVAKHLRIRVTPGGVQVVKPQDRDDLDVARFLQAKEGWVTNELDRMMRRRGIWKPLPKAEGTILLHGDRVRIVVRTQPGSRINRVRHEANLLTIEAGDQSPTAVATTLENWLRRAARSEIQSLLPSITHRVKRDANRVYVMGQRTKWGNCSAKRNLSFNWRLVMAPPLVLRYLVTHEVVHLAVPDHSRKFWLTLQSLCPETDRARQWLAANGHHLQTSLAEVCRGK